MLRALRAVCSIRKHLNSSGKGLEILKDVREKRIANTGEQGKSNASSKKLRTESGSLVPEEETYLAILEQVHISFCKFSITLD